MKKASFYYLLGIIIILLGWEVTSLVINNHLIIPSIDEVMKRLVILLSNPNTYSDILNSFTRTIIGFIISLLIAVVFSLLGELLPPIRMMLSPLISILKSLPTAAIIIFFILLIGFKNAPYYIVFILALPILLEGINTGFDNIDKELKDAMIIYGKSNRLYNLFKIKLPLTFSYISLAIITAFGLAFKAEIMSEVLIGSTNMKGIGFNLYYAKYYVDVISLFSWTIIIGVIVIIVDLLLTLLKSIINKKLYD